jgi:hypothetical protein
LKAYCDLSRERLNDAVLRSSSEGASDPVIIVYLRQTGF